MTRNIASHTFDKLTRMQWIIRAGQLDQLLFPIKCAVDIHSLRHTVGVNQELVTNLAIN